MSVQRGNIQKQVTPTNMDYSGPVAEKSNNKTGLHGEVALVKWFLTSLVLGW